MNFPKDMVEPPASRAEAESIAYPHHGNDIHAATSPVIRLTWKIVFVSFS